MSWEAMQGAGENSRRPLWGRCLRVQVGACCRVCLRTEGRALVSSQLSSGACQRHLLPRSFLPQRRTPAWAQSSFCDRGVTDRHLGLTEWQPPFPTTKAPRHIEGDTRSWRPRGFDVSRMSSLVCFLSPRRQDTEQERGMPVCTARRPALWPGRGGQPFPAGCVQKRPPCARRDPSSSAPSDSMRVE